MTYRPHKSIEVAELLEEGRAKQKARAAACAEARQKANEAVRGLVEYLAERQISAALCEEKKGIALLIEVSAARWPFGTCEQWRFFKVAETLDEVTPDAVARLVRTPGFVQCIDDFTAWRSGFEANGERLRKVVMRVAPLVVVSTIGALCCGCDPTLVTLLGMIALCVTFLVGLALAGD